MTALVWVVWCGDGGGGGTLALTSAGERYLKRRGKLRVQLYWLCSRYSLCHSRAVPRDSVRSRCRARALSADPTSQSLDGEHYQNRGECAYGGASAAATPLS